MEFLPESHLKAFSKDQILLEGLLKAFAKDRVGLDRGLGWVGMALALVRARGRAPPPTLTPSRGGNPPAGDHPRDVYAPCFGNAALKK